MDVLLDIRIEEILFGSPVYNQTVKLRQKILREPLGLILSPADLKLEDSDIHLVALFGEIVIACLFLHRISPDVLKMRQVAVDCELQGRGVGKRLVAYSETLAMKNNFSEMILSAREGAVPFYKSMGYEEYDIPKVEVGLAHHQMRKKLRLAK
jgi:N-acetylglutamate synthase-like GNAT family acetyltransferase